MSKLQTQKDLVLQDVQLVGKTILTNSLLFAKRFDINHKDLLVKIRKIETTYPTIQGEFIKSTFLNSRGREYPMYHLTRDAFMFLVMNAGTPKDPTVIMKYHDTQYQIITAFNLMEQSLARLQNDTSWNKSREQGKIARMQETDILKVLLDYVKSTEPDSTYCKRPNMLYSNYTRMTYKCLEFIQSKKPKTRDMLDMMELQQLSLAENIMSKVIQKGINEKEHYKVIYQNCKIALTNYHNTLFLT